MSTVPAMAPRWMPARVVPPWMSARSLSRAWVNSVQERVRSARAGHPGADQAAQCRAVAGAGQVEGDGAAHRFFVEPVAEAFDGVAQLGHPGVDHPAHPLWTARAAARTSSPPRTWPAARRGDDRPGTPAAAR